MGDEEALGWSVDAIEWRGRGANVAVGGDHVFVLDVAAAEETQRPPLVYLHGFPTSSIDLSAVIDSLALDRRVIALDYPGYGLSAKPDRRYTVAGCADAVIGVLEALGVRECSLLSHDMGDTVCGELLARNMAGEWDVEIVDRVITNGSIYLDLAQLTAGQQFLLTLPDERGDGALAPTVESMSATLAATLSPANHERGTELMRSAAEHLISSEGATLLPRLIRYLEERRDNEARFTGALEQHPSPVRLVWGADDPIAVVGMVERFCDARPDAEVVVLDGVGHYPMVEDPQRFSAAVRPAVGSVPR